MLSAKDKPLDLSFDAEIKACDDFFGSILRYIRKQKNYFIDVQLLKDAYEMAKKLHGDTRRKSGLLYLRHPLAAMECLSRLYCKTSVLAAALLHDTMEDCGYTVEKMREDFSPEIAEIVSAVTAIKEVEKSHDFDFENLTEEEKHDILDRMTDAKLIKSKYQRSAFLVRFADREHNLSTIDACSLMSRRLKIEQTENFLIPAAHQLGMRYFEISLNDYCFKFKEDNFKSEALKKFRNDCISVSSPVFMEFDFAFQRGIEKQDFFSFPPYNPFARSRRDRIEKRRLLTPYEIDCQLPDGARCTRGGVYLSEILLTCNEQNKGVIMTRFIEFYRKYLRQKDIFFEFDHEENDAVVVRLSDTYDNNYRVVMIPKEYLEAYFIGDPNGDPLTLVSEDSVADALRSKITVYAYSPYKGLREFCVPQGATALDFAFIVNKTLALTVKNAYIQKYESGFVPQFKKENCYHCKTILNDGDVVHFDADYSAKGTEVKNHASIEWFTYINTENARNCLVNYFKTIYP